MNTGVPSMNKRQTWQQVNKSPKRQTTRQIALKTYNRTISKKAIHQV